MTPVSLRSMEWVIFLVAYIEGQILLLQKDSIYTNLTPHAASIQEDIHTLADTEKFIHPYLLYMDHRTGWLKLLNCFSRQILY